MVGLRCLPDEKGRAEETICDTVIWAAGTGTLGYHLPPDGRGSSSIPVGANVRGHRRPPDLWLDRRLRWTGQWGLQIMKGSFVAGTSERHFHCPPDPVQGEAKLQQTIMDLAGTEMRGFGSLLTG